MEKYQEGVMTEPKTWLVRGVLVKRSERV